MMETLHQLATKFANEGFQAFSNPDMQTERSNLFERSSVLEFKAN